MELVPLRELVGWTFLGVECTRCDELSYSVKSKVLLETPTTLPLRSKSSDGEQQLFAGTREMLVTNGSGSTRCRFAAEIQGDT